MQKIRQCLNSFMHWRHNFVQDKYDRKLQRLLELFATQPLIDPAVLDGLQLLNVIEYLNKQDVMHRFQ